MPDTPPPSEGGDRPIVTIGGEKVALGPLHAGLFPFLVRWDHDFATVDRGGDDPHPRSPEAVAAFWEPMIRGERAVRTDTPARGDVGPMRPGRPPPPRARRGPASSGAWAVRHNVHRRGRSPPGASRTSEMSQSILANEPLAEAPAQARTTRGPRPAPIAGPTAVRRLLRLPILYKVLVANAAIVVLGAVAGTYLTVLATQEERGAVPLVLAFVVLGVVLSVVVNWLVLRAAFRPLTSLGRVAEAVRRGDLSARAEPTPFGDPQIAHLAATFNGTLDELERDRVALRSAASRVISAQEDERKRISRELHDDTAQVLFAQLLRLAALSASPNAEIRGTATALEAMTAEALEGVRRMAMELRPPALDDLGLQAALGALAQRFSEQLAIPIDYQARGPRGRLPAEVELILYRVAQEALTNVAKHARASHACIDLDRGTADVALSVRDDGTGFDPALETERDGRGLGLGLFGMEERVALVGGAFTIWSRPGAGTEIFAFIPLPPATPSPPRRA